MAAIITVDDSKSIRQMISFTLNEQGHNVIEAEDGKIGLEKLKDNKVDLIFTDLNMPNMDGIEFIKAVRADNNFDAVPIIMVTTVSESERKQEGKAAGATGWIVKPFEPDQLLSVVKKVLPKSL